MQKLPPLHALRVFEAVVICKSFSKAAEKLELTQSAVSHQVRNLERHLGFLVFDRSSKVPLLTTEGERLYKTAREAFALINQTCLELTHQQTAIRLRTEPTFAVHWLIPKLGHFYAKHPDIQIHLTTVWETETTYQWDKYDLAVEFGSLESSGTVLHKETMTPVCSPEIAAQLGSPASLEKLKDQLILHPTQGADDWSHWFSQQGVKTSDFKRHQYFDTDHIANSAALRGYGVAMADPVIMQEEINQKRLVAPFDATIETGKGYVIFGSNRNFSARKNIETFLEWINEELGK